MSQTFTVTWVGDKTREWKSERGTYIDYRIALAEYDAAKTVKLTQKTSTPAPTPGDTIFGGIIVEHATNRQTGEEFEVHKLKKEQAQDGRSGFKKATGVQAPLTPQTKGDEFWAAKDRRIGRAGIIQALIASEAPISGYAQDAAALQGYVAALNKVADAVLASLDERTPQPNASPSHGNGQGGGVTTPAPSSLPPPGVGIPETRGGGSTLEDEVLADTDDIPF